MSILASTALWFLPFVLPICLYVCWSDMAAMRITNVSVIALLVVFAVIGLIALPFGTYLWRWLAVIVVLFVGFLLSAGGLLGAGDAKFAAAAAPFIDPGDLGILLLLFAANMLAAFVTHRGLGRTALRRLAPEWESWRRDAEFPLGLSLGSTLAIYLILGAFLGS